jgi:hypothetical protein
VLVYSDNTQLVPDMYPSYKSIRVDESTNCFGNVLNRCSKSSVDLNPKVAKFDSPYGFWRINVQSFRDSYNSFPQIKANQINNPSCTSQTQLLQ